MPVTLGIDRALASGDLVGRRVGLVANPASVDRNLQHTADRLINAPGVTLAALFGPQHGFHASAQDNMIETPHGIDGGAEYSDIDNLVNTGTIKTLSDATAKGISVSVNLLGGVATDGNTTARAITTGIKGGVGEDLILIRGVLSSRQNLMQMCWVSPSRLEDILTQMQRARQSQWLLELMLAMVSTRSSPKAKSRSLPRPMRIPLPLV